MIDDRKREVAGGASPPAGTSRGEPTGERRSAAGSADGAPPRGDETGRVAAVDLGSNSFHLLVARVDAGEPRVIERLKLRVQLAAAVDATGALSDAGRRRALDAVARIADRLGDIPRSCVRAVGTSAMRSLARPKSFLDEIEGLLGVPVRIVGGEEEASLVFLGAAETLPESDHTRLVVDVGGGSTELALGSGHQAEQVISLPIGCVGVSLQALGTGGDGAAVMARALAEARALLARPEVDAFVARAGWEAVATSGTAGSIRSVLRARGWASDALSRALLQRLAELLAAEPHLPVPMAGLEPDKEDVLPGGLAILLAVCERLGLDRLTWTEGALQDGLVRELVPLPEGGLRAHTVSALQQRFGIDVEVADRLQGTVGRLLAALGESLGLDSGTRLLLDAAAALHEIGMSVAPANHERHGAWLLRHAELRGFGAEEREALVVLVRGQRGPWPELALTALPTPWRGSMQRACLLLRLALILSPAGLALPELRAEEGAVSVQVTPEWRRHHPLLADRLERECALQRELAVPVQLVCAAV